MAVSALCCASEGAPNETKLLFSGYAVQLIALLDDNSIITRGYTLRCLLNCGPLKIECLKPIAFGVLARLDDPSAEIRQYAAQVIGKLELDEINENDSEIWSSSVEHLLARMILHLDNPEIKLKELLLGKVWIFFFFLVSLWIKNCFSYFKTQLKVLLNDIQKHLKK